MSKAKSRTSSLFAGFAVLLTLLAVVTAFLHQQLIIDHLRSWQYEPAAKVVALRDKLDLTAEGKLYFDASHSALKPANEFNQHCQQYEETNNPIIGCYVSQRIFVFDIDNPRLNGIEETTAAHEVLHAAYDRLPEGERRTIDDELQKTYERVRTPELEERMDYYQKTEPGQRMNELHSILGTEFSDVGNALERHYAVYFNDRAKIVAYYDAYNTVFTSVTNKLTSLERQINTMIEDINDRIVTYNAAIARLESDADAFQRRNQSGGFTNQAEFNAAQNELLARQAELNAERDQINAAIDAAKSLRRQYNVLVQEYNQLSQSINSSLTPIPALQ